MARAGRERIVINGRLNSRARWFAMGKGENDVVYNFEQQDDGSLRARAPWVFPRRPNLLTVNQASLETDTTGWAAAVNCSIARAAPSFGGLNGSNALRLTATGAGDMSATTPTGVSGRAVIAGRSYTASAGVRPDINTPRSAKLYIRWYNSGGTFLSEVVGVSNSNFGFWTTLWAFGVAPVGAAFAAIAVEIISAAAAEVHWTDAIGLSFGTGFQSWSLPAAGTPQGGTNVFWSGLETANMGGVYVSRRDSGSSSITIHRADDEQTPDWGTAVIDTLSGANWMVPFVAGNGIVLYGNFSFPNDRLRFWNGSVAADASTVAIAGRALAYHKERFWSAGPDAQPTRLYYSGINDHTSWDLNNYVPVGPDDGGVIEDIAPALGGLLIAKSNSIWFLTGDGPLTFVLTKLDGGEGNWGRCICATPYGAVIAGTKDVYLWQGGAVEPITSEHPDYTPGGSWVTTAFRDDKVFITTNGNLWVRDMAAEKWRKDRTATTDPDSLSAICAGGTDLDRLLGVAQSTCDVSMAGLLTCDVLTAVRRPDDGMRGYVQQIITGFFPLGPLGSQVTVDRVTILVNQLELGDELSTLNVAIYRPFGVENGSSVASLGIPAEDLDGIYRYTFEGTRLPQPLVAFSAIQVISPEALNSVLWDIIDVEVEYHIEEPY